MISLWRNELLRACLGVVFFISAIACLLVLQTTLQTRQQVVTTRPLPFDRSPGLNSRAAQPPSGAIEHRSLEIGWPEKISKDELGWILLTIHAPQAESPGAGGGGAPAAAGETLPAVYETDNLVASARLELAGWDAAQAEYKQPVRPGQPVTFRWEIQPAADGRYQGTLWLHLEFVPKGGGAVEELLLLARPVAIQSVSLGGLSRRQAQAIGWGSLLAGAICVYPWLRRRMRPETRPIRAPGQASGRSRTRDL